MFLKPIYIMEYGPLIIRNMSIGEPGYLTFLFCERDIKQTATAHKVHTCAGKSASTEIYYFTYQYSQPSTWRGSYFCSAKHIYLIKSKLAVLEPQIISLLIPVYMSSLHFRLYFQTTFILLTFTKHISIIIYPGNALCPM